jgi:hypothetical protein
LPIVQCLQAACRPVPATTDEMQQTKHPLALGLLEINTQRKSLVKMHVMFL